MEKVKIGIIGVGNIAQEHIHAYKQNPYVELYAFCDINPQRLKEMGELHGITRCYTSEREMLDALPELDAVSVCTWNNQHAPCTIMALEAGKNVLCEKPMATSVAEAEKMLETARRCNRLLMIGFVCRFGKDCALMEDFVHSDFFGEMYYAKATYLRRCGNPAAGSATNPALQAAPLLTWAFTSST